MSQLEPELEEIILRLKSNQQNQEGISELSTKLELIEKMIASEAVESQLIKDRYYGFKNQRCNISSHHSKKLLASSSFLNDRSPLRTSTYRSEKKAESLSKYISTSRLVIIQIDKPSPNQERSFMLAADTSNLLTFLTGKYYQGLPIPLTS